MATVIAAIGGSLLRPEIEERHAWLEGLVSVIRDRVSMEDRIGIVVGGGAPAREGIDLARPLINNEGHLDKIMDANFRPDRAPASSMARALQKVLGSDRRCHDGEPSRTPTAPGSKRFQKKRIPLPLLLFPPPPTLLPRSVG